jgi:MFS family permease
MKLFSKESAEELKVLWPFYLEAFLGTILFVLVPFEVVYFNSIGLNMKQVGVLIAVWPLASLLFEIPTGAIADLYGRKFSVMLGWTLQGLVFCSIFLVSDYYFLLALMALIGIASTFTTGSYEAWVIDLIKAKGLKNKVHDYFAKRQSLINLAFVFSGVLGAVSVAFFGIKIIWPMSGLALFLSVLFLYFGKEVYEKPKLHVKKSFFRIWSQIKKSVSYGLKHRTLFLLLLIIFVWGLAFAFEGFISWTPFLKSYNFPDWGFGYLWSAMALVGVFAPLLSKKITKKNKERKMLIITASLSLIMGFFVLAANSLAFIIFLLFLGSFLIDFEIPIWNVYFHRHIPSKIRATVGSVRGMLFSLAGIVSLPLAGFIADKFGGRIAVFIASMIAIPVIFLYSRIKGKD